MDHNSTTPNTGSGGVPIDGMFSGPESSIFEEVPRKEFPDRQSGPEGAFEQRAIRPEAEEGMIRLPAEQFTAMVGALLSAMGRLVSGQIPDITTPTGEKEKGESGPEGFQGGRAQEGGARGLGRRGGAEENGREERDREIGEGQGEGGGRMDERGANPRPRRQGLNREESHRGREKQAGGRRPRGGARSPSVISLEEVNSSESRGRGEKAKSRRTGPGEEPSTSRSRRRTESGDTSEQVRELRVR